MIEANKFKLGVFISIGIAIIIGGIFIFGMSQFFTKKVEIYTVFTDEVEGLTIGAPVKFNGVTLGSVSNIYIVEDGNIEVQMQLSFKSIREKIKTPLKTLTKGNRTLSKEIDKLVQAGLRCSLQLRGITGDKCIMLGYYKGAPDCGDLRLTSINKNFYYIPSVPSYLDSVFDNLGKLLRDLSKKDLCILIDEFNKNLQALNRIANNLDTLSKVDIQRVTDNLNKNLHIIGRLADRIDKALISLNPQELSDSLLNTINKLDEMSNSLTILSNNLNSNPSSIVWGRKEEKILRE